MESSVLDSLHVNVLITITFPGNFSRSDLVQIGEILGVFDWATSVTYVLTFLTMLCSTGTGNEAM